MSDIQKIVIVGGGTAGWISAAILAKGLAQQNLDISVIESAAIPSVGVGEATIPPILLLLQYLEIEENAFLSQVNGTYKYGIHFDGWAKQGHSYMHAFGNMGTDTSGLAFPDLYLKCRENLDIERFNDFSPSAVAAYSNKFHPASPLPKNANTSHFYPLSEMFYAFHFDAAKLAEVLGEYAKNLGVSHTTGTVTSIINDDNGHIDTLMLNDGTKINGDIFVDCSGTRGLLNQQHYNCKYIDWRQYLPCDRAIPIQTERLDPLPPYTKSIAMDAGWRWQIPLQTRTGNGYVFSSEFCSDDKAIDDFTQALEGHTKLTSPRVIHFKTGCLEQPWYKNSVAIGLSSGFFEPLESTSIHLIHKFAIELKNALLSGNEIEQKANKFNQEFARTSIQIRDFLVAHYHINQRTDNEFWKYCRNMPIPDTLRAHLQEFTDTGRITLPDDSLFTYENYLQVLLGQEFLTDYTKFIDPTINLEGATGFFNNVRNAISVEVNKVKSHTEFLQGI